MPSGIYAIKMKFNLNVRVQMRAAEGSEFYNRLGV